MERSEWQSFKRGCIAVFVLLIIVGGGLVYRSKTEPKGKPTAKKSLIQKESLSKKLPADIPLYEEAKLLKEREYGGGATFEFSIPLTTPEEVSTFYQREMAARGWKEYAAGATSLNFYKEDGKQVKITLRARYRETRLIIQIEEESS